MNCYKLLAATIAAIQLAKQQWREILRSAFNPIAPTAAVRFGRKINRSVGKRSREYKSDPEEVDDGSTT